MYSPPPEAALEETHRAFLDQLNEVSELVRASNGLDLARVKTVLPAISFCKMPLGARYFLVTAHNRRHLWQAMQVRQHVQFPAK